MSSSTRPKRTRPVGYREAGVRKRQWLLKGARGGGKTTRTWTRVDLVEATTGVPLARSRDRPVGNDGVVWFDYVCRQRGQRPLNETHPKGSRMHLFMQGEQLMQEYNVLVQEQRHMRRDRFGQVGLVGFDRATIRVLDARASAETS